MNRSINTTNSSINSTSNGTEIEYLSTIKLEIMKRRVKTKSTAFIQFAPNKILKGGFDLALVKLGVDNKWTVK